jgi:hypothetical protein
MVKVWGVGKNDIPKIRMRLKVKGYTSDKNKLLAAIKNALKDFTFYDNEEPDLTEVSVFDDPERTALVEKIKNRIEKLDWDDRITSKEDILEKALHIILKE